MLHLRGIKKVFFKCNKNVQGVKETWTLGPRKSPLENFNKENDKKKTSLKTMF